VVGFGLLALPALASANDQEDRIKGRIESRFEHDAQLKDDSVKVEVDGSKVTLTGTVDTSGEKARAARLARVKGVAKVNNELEVDGGVMSPEAREDRAERIEDRADHKKEEVDRKAEAKKSETDRKAEAAKQEIERDAKAAKQKIGEGAHEMGTEVSDSWITTKVKTEIATDDRLKGSDISVDTNQSGEVTLTGTVPTMAARERAIELTRGVKGVRAVKDTLSVVPARK
jgi:osmotically-inducible protein OsmY